MARSLRSAGVCRSCFTKRLNQQQAYAAELSFALRRARRQFLPGHRPPALRCISHHRAHADSRIGARLLVASGGSQESGHRPRSLCKSSNLRHSGSHTFRPFGPRRTRSRFATAGSRVVPGTSSRWTPQRVSRSGNSIAVAASARIQFRSRSTAPSALPSLPIVSFTCLASGRTLATSKLSITPPLRGKATSFRQRTSMICPARCRGAAIARCALLHAETRATAVSCFLRPTRRCTG
jgi:hypothetical protein